MVDKFIIHDQKEVMNTTYINLFTTTKCQLNCLYCIEKHRMGNDYSGKSSVGVPMFKRIMKFIDLQETENVFFHFYGGEPTMNKYLVLFMKMLKERYGDKVRIKLSTNLEKDREYFLQIPDYVEIWASRHLGYQTLTHDSWFERAIMLNKRDMLKKIFIMCDIANYGTAIELYHNYKKQLPHLMLYPIDSFRSSASWQQIKNKFDHHDPFEDYQFVDIEVDGERFKEKPTVEKFNNFKDHICNAGFDISVYGDVTWCSSYYRKETLLNLILHEPKKIDRIHICQADDCPCDPEFAKHSVKKYLGEMLK